MPTGQCSGAFGGTESGTGDWIAPSMVMAKRLGFLRLHAFTLALCGISLFNHAMETFR